MEVVIKLEETKDPDIPWSMATLRKTLHHYVSVHENAQRYALTNNTKGQPPSNNLDTPVPKTIITLTIKGSVLYHTQKRVVNLLMCSQLVYSQLMVVAVAQHLCLAYFVRASIIMTCVTKWFL